MVKQVNKMLNKILSKVSQPKKTQKRKTKISTKTNRRVMPAAYTVNYRKKFGLNRSGSSVFVTGNDLVYKVPDSLYTTASAQDVFCLIPSNPAYWLGTRIAAIASGYQYYRPVFFKIHYVPQVAVTQPGNVVFGTLWNDVPTPSSLQQSLKTSPGGDLVQCYKSTSKVIPLRNNLPQRNFKIAGEITDDSMPFVFMAICPGVNSGGSSIIPGYFYVEYKYRFCNPIGGGSTSFYNSELVTFSSVTEVSNNMTFILASTLDDRTGSGLYLGAGSKLDVEIDSEGDMSVFYHGTEIQASTDSAYGIFLSNTQISPTLLSRSVPYSVSQHLIYKYHVTTEDQNISISPGEMALLVHRESYSIDFVKTVYNYNEVLITETVLAPESGEYYVCIMDTTDGYFENEITLGDLDWVAADSRSMAMAFVKPVKYELIFYLSPETSSSSQEIKLKFAKKRSIRTKYSDVSKMTIEETKIFQDKKIDSESITKLRSSNVASQISEIAKSAGIRLY